MVYLLYGFEVSMIVFLKWRLARTSMDCGFAEDPTGATWVTLRKIHDRHSSRSRHYYSDHPAIPHRQNDGFHVAQITIL